MRNDLDSCGAFICRDVAHAVCSHAAKGGDPTTDNYAIAFKPSFFTRDKDGAPSEVYPPLSADADKGDQEAVVLVPVGIDGGEVGFSLRANPSHSGDKGDGGMNTTQVVAYRTAGNCGPFEQGDKTGCLNTATDPNQNIIVQSCFDERQVTSKTNRSRCEAEVSGTSHSTPHSIATGSAVRRLTPRECERLQGFPDDWTAGFADSTRYRMLGNAVAVPVAEWIFKRLSATLINQPTP